MLQTSVRCDYGVLALNATSALSSPDPLRRWLRGRWALLFSHPDDFAGAGFEADRWLVCLRDTFATLRLKPIAIGPTDGTHWISRAGGRFIPRHIADELLPVDTHSASERFVTILDGGLRPRRTYLYKAGSQAPCAIELAHGASNLRQRSVPESVRRMMQSV